jgi:Protein-arginine deiminase (PAD)
VNTLAPPGFVARLHADYERNGTLDATEAEHLVRLLRPGAILLANLDISDMTRLPTPPPADLVPLLDGKDDITNGAADEKQLTAARTEVPAGIASRAKVVVMRVDAKDAARIRAFTTSFSGALLLTGFGDPANNEIVVKDGVTFPDPDFQLEAITLPGDPNFPAPTGATPAKPLPVPPAGKSGPFSAKLPPGSSGSPVFSKRAPADVWAELVHQDSGGADLKSPREVALFTIAPFILLCGIQPATRVFVVNAVDLSTAKGVFAGNHNFIFDLAEACQAVFGAPAVTLPPNEAAPFTPSTPADTGPFYLIDGAKFPDNSPGNTLGFADPWAQDEMEIGYCFAPHASMHVVLHCKRSRGLDAWIHAELPGPGMGIFDGLHASGPSSDAVHYGGNLEATPPVPVATPALSAGATGPAVKAHRPAPFGKILLGDFGTRKVDGDYRNFLIAQHIQPALPVDTSWLDVGHVDEFISFVPDSSPKGFKMLFGSVKAMNVLLKEASKVPISNGRTHFHRGKWTDGLKKTGYDETSVEDLLTNAKTFNDRVRNEKLIPIYQRLQAGLHLAESDIVHVPTYFTPPATPKPKLSDTPTVAQTVGMVNMLVLGSHLMIPKPFGPRMQLADAQAVLERAFKQLGIKSPVVLPSTGDVRWVEPGELPERMVCYYTDAPTDADRQNIIDHINKSSVALSPANAALVAARAAEIAAANASNSALTSQLVPAITGSAFTVWLRITVPDSKVDLIEAYMLSVLSPLGCTVHFVDDWFYHSQEGEAHCATNAVRELPEDSDSKRWWDTYDPTVDASYSP